MTLTIKLSGKKEIEKIFQKFLGKKLKYLSNKNGFLGIDNKFNFKEKVIIVPFGLEKTVSYGGGTKNGPKEIIKASHQVELYDEELNCEPYKKIGIKTLKPFKIDKNITKALKKMSNINELLKYSLDSGASDLHLSVGSTPMVRSIDTRTS